MYTPPVTPWELGMPEASDLTERKELSKAGSITGVKSKQGSRIGRCGWITSFLRKSSREFFTVELLMII